MTPIPRPEHPRPQFRRAQWRTLNGRWQFEVDRGDSGLERGLVTRELASSIVVPFAPESEASGVGDTDFLEAVWYRRDLVVPDEWTGRVLLHFGAVDYDTTVWVDGVEAGRHRGGFASFHLDVTALARPGEAVPLVVRARDPRGGRQARGKQATWYQNSHYQYTRTTGIWQTVWIEHVPPRYLDAVSAVPQLATASFELVAELAGSGPVASLEAVLLRDDGHELSRVVVPLGVDATPRTRLAVPAGEVRHWSPDDPYLYGLRFLLRDAAGAVVDTVESYAGLRSVTVDGDSVLLNGRRVYQRLVLDQGYWPSTLMTAPSDAALEQDIRLAMAAGFNGARLHQKVFEERYLYHADRLGYLVWAEFGDWGVSGNGPEIDNQQPTTAFVSEWLEVLRRDRNHPAIVGWCPLNETHQVRHDRTTNLDDVTLAMFLATKAADPTRPVIDASGYSHRVPATDVYDAHTYEQDPAALARLHEGLSGGRPFVNDRDGRPFSVPYAGQPYFVSEYGGIWWDASERPGDRDAWEYGNRVADVDELVERFAALTRVLLRHPGMFGHCYTQLTDVFQERNGVYTFDRAPKLDVARLRAVQAERAAYEERDG